MYRVRWRRSARDELTLIWLRIGSAERNDVTRATHEIDEALRSNPIGNSESRDAGNRIAINLPIGVRFRIDENTRTVYVLEVWFIR